MTAADPAPEIPPALEADRLVKHFGQRQAVRGVSLRVAKGEILALLGPNGAGKTTTLRMLAGTLRPTSGSARIAGFDAFRNPMEARRRLGFLPETTPLYNSMTVRGYLEFMAELKGVPRARRTIVVDRAIEECGLADSVKRVTAGLSRGVKQRLGLAQAVLGDPEAVILDEPTVGLDPRQIAGIRELIRSMAGRRSVILSTHILPEAALVCSRAAVVHQGRIVAEGPPGRLSGGGEDSALIRVAVAGPADRAREAAEKVRGVVRVECGAGPGEAAVLRIYPSPALDPRPELARALTAAGVDLLEMTSEGPTLEEVFLRVIAKGEAAAAAA